MKEAEVTCNALVVLLAVLAVFDNIYTTERQRLCAE